MLPHPVHELLFIQSPFMVHPRLSRGGVPVNSGQVCDPKGLKPRSIGSLRIGSWRRRRENSKQTESN